MTIHSVNDPASVATTAATWIHSIVAQHTGRFSICLSGGSTPRLLYEELARDAALPWNRVHWFFGDERFVAHDHPDSNYAMVNRALFSPAAVPASNIHAIPTTGTPEQSAASYHRELLTYYGSERLEGGRYLFDLVLLGLGEDGHIASLFPGVAALEERTQLATAVKGARPEPRITLTYPALESARNVAFLVTGTAKRKILEQVWQSGQLPAGRLRPQGATHWFIDRAADPR